MKALRVTCRGEPRTIALKHQGVLSVIVTCAEGGKPDPEEKTDLLLGALDTQANAHLEWAKLKLEAGDKVVIEVVENCVADTPDEVRPRDADEERKHQEKHLRDSAKALGWTIVENGDESESI